MMDKKFIAFLLALALAFFAAVTAVTQNQPKTIKEQFEQWKAEHGPILDLTPEENEYRLRVFTENVETVNQHNGLLGRNYDKGINKFTAYTQAEFEAKFLSKIEPTTKYEVALEPTIEGLKVDVDWVAKGAVSPVKNQGSCVASYAFSAIGGIEGISVIFFKQQMEYSVQQLVDCSQSYGNNGCTTGTMVSSFNYISAKGTV
jgi:C1A family cysteine protease